MAEPGRAAEISDVSIDRLIFDVITRGKHGLSTGVGDALTGGKVEQTMVGASSLTLELRDRQYELLQSGLFGSRVLVNLDGVDYRMTQVSLIDDQRLRVLFELALIAEMREHTSTLKAKRETTTRAQFVLMMLRQLKLAYTFISPELRKVQSIEATQAEVGAATEAAANAVEKEKEPVSKAGRAPAVSKGNLTVKHVAVTDAQVTILTEGLQAASETGASPLSAEALVVALIQEADVSNPPTGDKDSRGALQVRQSTANGIAKRTGSGSLDPMNVSEVVAHFCTAGYYGKGGSNALARAHPTWTPGEIAQACQGSAYPAAYDLWKDEAKAIVAAYAGGGLSFHAAPTGPAQATVATSTYEFSRGKPGLPEDTFTCGLRLAEEVLWRFFVVARKSNIPAVYFVTEDDLIRAKPRYLIDPTTVGAGKLTFDAEVGRRTVIMRGRRQPKPSEARLEVRMGRWDAPPGTVIEFADYGPGDGKWLVDTIERDLYSAHGLVHLKKPQEAVPEPLKGTTATGTKDKEGGTVEATAAQKTKLATEHPELHQGVREVVAAILAKFPGLVITSTFRPGGTSYHALGRACDVASGDSNLMLQAAEWVGKHFTPVLVEGIHNPNLSVKNGAKVDPSLWGPAVWQEHQNHIHVAV